VDDQFSIFDYFCVEMTLYGVYLAEI